MVVEEDSPTKPKQVPSANSLTLKAATLSKYYEEINYYDPFGHEEST